MQENPDSESHNLFGAQSTDVTCSISTESIDTESIGTEYIGTKRIGNESIRTQPLPREADEGRESYVPRLDHPVSPSDIFDFLRSLREFSRLPESELRTFAQSCRLATVEAGTYIIHEGDERSLNGFIVASGLIGLLKTSICGKELIVELLQSGDVFGLLLTIAKDRIPEQLSVRALNASTILWAPIDSFKHTLKYHPSLFEDCVAHLILCLQSSYQLSRGLAHDRVEVRMASILCCSLAMKFGNGCADGQDCTIRFTRQQLADLIGTTPETAIRVTRAMQRDGIIKLSVPGVIRILNIEALRRISEV